MSNKKRELIVMQDDTVLVREIIETPCKLSDQLIQEMCADMTMSVYNEFDIPDWGKVNSCHRSNGISFHSLFIGRIPLRAPYRLIQGIMVPHFSSTTDPVISLNWNIPGDMTGIVLIQTQASLTSMTAMNANPMWVLMRDCHGALWRLPLGNLHDDGKLCTGQSGGFNASTRREAIIMAMNQFANGQWNQDLWKSNENTQKMFRFKPLNNTDAFSQEQMDCESWTDLCEKIAPSVAREIVG